jgi:hypothetical protein
VFSINNVQFSIPILTSFNSLPVGCVAVTSASCPSAYPVAFAESTSNPAWQIQACTSQTSCPPYVVGGNTRWFVPAYTASNDLTACLTTNFGANQIGTCPQTARLNFTINVLEPNPTGVAGSPATWTVGCLAAGAQCNSAQPVRFYGRSPAAPTQTYCTPMPATGSCSSNLALNVPPYAPGTGGTYSVNITSSTQALLGCVINTLTACPAEYPVEVTDANNNIVGCSPSGTSITCPAGTIPARNTGGIVVRCLPAIPSSGECPSDSSGINFPISVRSNNGSILECMALGSICPASAPFEFYAVGFSGVTEAEPAALRQCWPSGTTCTWQTYTVEIRPSDLSPLTGCVSSTALICPVGNQLAYRNANMRLFECRPSTQTTCPTELSPPRYSAYTIEALNSGALVACLSNVITACPAIFPIPASDTINSELKACLTITSQCAGQWSFFIANNLRVTRCILPAGLTSCNTPATTGATIEVYGNAAATNLIGCLLDGSTKCPAVSILPFYAFANTAWGLAQCRPGLANPTQCPSDYSVPGRDVNLAIASCISTAGVTFGVGTSCPSPTITQFSIPVVQFTPELRTAPPTDCLSNEITECPTSLIGGTLDRSFNLYSGYDPSTSAAALAACIAPVTGSCDAQPGYLYEVYDTPLNAVTPGLAGCVSSNVNTPCPTVSPFVVLSEIGLLKQCNTPGTSCSDSFPIRFVKPDDITLAGCMGRDLALTDCPTYDVFTPGFVYSFELFGRLSNSDISTPALAQCRVAPRPPVTDCTLYGAFSVPMFTSADFTGTVAACALPLIRCPAQSEVGTPYPSFLTQSSGGAINACTSAVVPSCSGSNVTNVDGSTVIGCIGSNAPVAACAALATSGGYPTLGTSTTFKFRAAGTSAAATLSSCTLSAAACPVGSGSITSNSTQVGCSTFDANAGCGTFASSLSPQPYPGPMTCITV